MAQSVHDPSSRARHAIRCSLWFDARLGATAPIGVTWHGMGFWSYGAPTGSRHAQGYNRPNRAAHTTDGGNAPLMSVLLVMEDGLDAQLTAHLLAQIDEHVVTVGTVAEAQHCLVEHLWSVVILDDALSDGGGWDMLRALTVMKTESGVLVLGTSRQVHQRVQALEKGADDYLVRPYQPAELLARVKALRRRFRQRIERTSSATLHVGGIELHANELEVTLPDSRRKRLSPTEMRLLHYLMARAPQVVAPAELLARLFGPAESDTASNAIGVYMRRVRRKIEPDPRHPRYIQTVRGSGYRFCSDGGAPSERSEGYTTPSSGV